MSRYKKIKRMVHCDVCGKKLRQKKMITLSVCYDYGFCGGGKFYDVCSEECMDVIKRENPEAEIYLI